MEINKEYIWVTPDPEKVRRFIAICENGRGIEVYLGEKWLVHKSRLYELQTHNFIQCDNKAKVFETPEDAENALDVYKIVVK